MNIDDQVSVIDSEIAELSSHFAERLRIKELCPDLAEKIRVREGLVQDQKFARVEAEKQQEHNKRFHVLYQSDEDSEEEASLRTRKPPPRASARTTEYNQKSTHIDKKKPSSNKAKKRELVVGDRVRVVDRKGLKYRNQTAVIVDFTPCHVVIELDLTGAVVKKWKDNVKLIK